LEAYLFVYIIQKRNDDPAELQKNSECGVNHKIEGKKGREVKCRWRESVKQKKSEIYDGLSNDGGKKGFTRSHPLALKTNDWCGGRRVRQEGHQQIKM